MTTDIPKARDMLAFMAINLRAIGHDDFACQIEHEILPLMTRTIQNKPQKRIARKITSRIVAQVLAIKDAEPTITHLEIGNRLRINPGRVCEILTGQRTVDNPNPDSLKVPEGMADLPWKG